MSSQPETQPISSLVNKLPNPPKESPITENSDTDTELTTEEITQALMAARNKKARQQYTRQYWERVNEPITLPTAEAFGDWVLRETRRSELASDGTQLNPRYLGPEGFRFVSPLHKTLFDLLCWYFTRDDRFEQAFLHFPALIGSRFSLEKGIALFGPTGCGKTTLLRIFTANPRESYTVMPCLSGAETFKKSGEAIYDELSGRSSFYGGPFRHSSGGRAFDDLGREPVPVFFYRDERNLMADLIERRYALGASVAGMTHLSTNLTADQIETRYGARVRSRLREMTNIIQFPPDTQDLRQ